MTDERPCSHERRYVGVDQDWEPFVYCADCRIELRPPTTEGIKT